MEIKKRLKASDIPPSALNELMQENSDTELVALQTVSQADLDAHYQKSQRGPSWINHGTLNENAFWAWSKNHVYFVRRYWSKYTDERVDELYSIPIRPGIELPDIVGIDD